ncbi:hypothetical protein Tco_1265259 [Tanacetum coccineum]
MSPGKVSPSSFSARPIPGEKSPGKLIPSDKSPGIPRICRWGKWQITFPPDRYYIKANYLGELVRELPLHYPSWRQVPAEQKAGVMAQIGEEMLRLQGLGSNTETGVPYTEDEIMAIVRGGKQRGHIPDVGRVLPGQGTVIPPPPPCTHSSDVVKLKKREKVLTRQVNMFMKLFRSDDKFSQMLTQLESQPEIGGGSGSGGRGDDEQGHDEDDGEDGEDEDDS